MPDAQTLIDLLHTGRAASQELAFFKGPQQYHRFTVQELEQAALLRLGTLQAAGLTAGAEVIMPLEENSDFIEVFWAAQLGGLIPMPLSPPTNAASCAKILDILAARPAATLIASEAGLGRLKDALSDPAVEKASREPWRSLDLEQRQISTSAKADQAGVPVPRSPGDIAFIQYSSGSTRAPKGVIVRQAQVLANLRAITSGLNLHADDRTFSWMPLSHDMGLVGFHLTPLYAGADQALMPTSAFARTPLLWLQEAAALGSTILSSPNFGYRHLLRAIDRKGMPADLDLSGVRLILNGAEPISVELATEFNERLAGQGLPDTAILPVYGLAEATLAVSFPALGGTIRGLQLRRDQLGIGATVAVSEQDQSLAVCGCGYALPGIELRMADEAGSELGPDRVGRIWIRGASVTEGYYDDPEATAEALQPDGWLDTGDLGLLRDGELFITGRRKDLVIVDGQNFYPHDLELSLQNALNLDPLRVAVAPVRRPGAVTEEVGVFILHRGEIDQFAATQAAARGHLSTVFGIGVELVLPVQQIPRTTSGKVQRLQLAEALHAGDYDSALASLQPDLALSSGEAQGGPPSSPPESNDTSPAGMEAMLKDFCVQVLVDVSFGPQDNLFEQGMSSIDLAEIHGLVDARYPKGLDIRDFFDHPSLRGLSQVLSERVQSGTVEAS